MGIGYDWDKALDALKALQGVDSDANLAKSLGITPSFLSMVRVGKKNIPPGIAREILIRLGHKLVNEYQPDEPLPKKSSIKSPAPLLGVRKFVSKRANGRCELCHQNAPFLLASGEPYLEFHHLNLLEEDIDDNQNNLILLCPNCHKRIHILQDISDIELINKILK
jgi:5-methylcytosine-specific restriction endonuclease McrA